MNSLNLFEKNKDTILEETVPITTEEGIIKIDEQNSESDHHLPALNLEENSLMSSKCWNEFY